MLQNLTSNDRLAGGSTSTEVTLMSRSKSRRGLVFGLALLGTFAVFGTSNASAEHGHDHGHANDPGHNQGSRYGNYRNYRSSYYSTRNPVSLYGGYGRTYYPRQRSSYHDTSHLHYQRPSYRWHNDHIDYVPGRFSVHRTGHFH